MNNLSLKILRYGWVILFLWFGVQQIMNPGAWVGFLPAWTGYFPIPGEILVQLNGWMEIIGASFLLIGAFVRPVAIILSLHLFVIAAAAGGAIGVRDFVLALMGVALAAAGPDDWTIDKRML
jgi:uncharacterized membrane protein YphA (DoxX/SURF4 family)